MNCEELNRLNKIELRIYSSLGIEFFRKAILCFEKFKHRRNEKQNKNYHISGGNIVSIEKFNGFLLYNAFIHCVSLLLGIACLVISVVYNIGYVAFNTALVLLLLLNLYCIFLQRYNYLRLKEHCGRYYGRVLNRADALYRELSVKADYTDNYRNAMQDYMLICRMRKAFDGESDCKLLSEDIESLARICKNVKPLLPKKKEHRDKMQAKSKFIDKCKTVSSPYTESQARANRLQAAFCPTMRKVLDYKVIMTENAECERLYKMLVPEDTENDLCFAVYSLHKAYADMAAEKIAYEG